MTPVITGSKGASGGTCVLLGLLQMADEVKARHEVVGTPARRVVWSRPDLSPSVTHKERRTENSVNSFSTYGDVEGLSPFPSPPSAPPGPKNLTNVSRVDPSSP